MHVSHSEVLILSTQVFQSVTPAHLHQSPKHFAKLQIHRSPCSSGDGAQETEFLTSSLGNSNSPLVSFPTTGEGGVRQRGLEGTYQDLMCFLEETGSTILTSSDFGVCLHSGDLVPPTQQHLPNRNLFGPGTKLMTMGSGKGGPTHNLRGEP